MLRQARDQDRTRGRERGLVPRLAAFAMAVIMLIGVLHAGTRYVYCPAMHAVMDAPCCGGDHGDHDDDVEAPQVRARSCCERHVLGKLPSAAATSTAPPVLAAPVAAMLPAPGIESGLTRALMRRGPDHDGRAGPRASARHRAELMVSLN